MDLSFNIKMEAYYQKFFELQERLRKSEEERAKLEMKFNELVQISKEEEQVHYKKLRAQYKRFLDEDRKRQERNDKIIRTLERIESRVNMLTSKTERIKMLRRQYQNYLERVSRKPVERKEYFPSKTTEQSLCNEHRSLFDDNSSNDVAMLKKAYGKTNDEKIEILDKYLQSLKSQKVASEPKTNENNTHSNELKYLEEVSKRLDDGFNSNDANSIAEEIMNSIYARHYKKDLSNEEPKKASKFTTPNFVSQYSAKDQNAGYGDSYNNYSVRNYPPLDFQKKNLSNDCKMGNNLTNKERSGISTKDNSIHLSQFEDSVDKDVSFHKTFENKPDLNENLSLPKKEAPKLFKNEVRFAEINENNIPNSPSKTEIDLHENEKQNIENFVPNKENPLVLGNPPPDIGDLQAAIHESEIKISTENMNELEKTVKGDSTDEVLNAITDPGNYGIKPENQIYEDVVESEIKKCYPNDNNLFGNDMESLRATNSNNVILENVESIQRNEDKLDAQDLNSGNTAQDENNSNMDQYKESDQPTEYDKSDDPVPCDKNKQFSNQSQYENSDEVYGEKIHPYEQINQYDPNEQPVEQLYGENGKALQQYDESGQPLYSYGEKYNENSIPDNQVHEQNDNKVEHYNNDDQAEPNTNGQAIQQCDENSEPIQLQQYNETGQADQQYDENGQPIQQYDENGQLIQQYDENGQLNQQYDANGQIIQQYDENGQHIQQYDENGQLIPQYDDNGQLIPQYDENGQLIQQYDANGQLIQQYDENGQLIQQYDEHGQPTQQYDENGQTVEQYDENGQPLYFNQDVQPVQYDENGQIVQYDENGQPITQNAYNESYENYATDGQPVEQYDEQMAVENEAEQNPAYNCEQPENIESDVKREDSNVKFLEENVNCPSKKKNILDLLDTDSESVKQNTSKISNDSDFDFSNG